MRKIVKIFKVLFRINILKTIYFNFKYLSFCKAVQFPAFVYNRTLLHTTSGKLILNVPIQMGMIKIGYHCLGIQDPKYTRTIWQVSGNFIINGTVVIGRGSRICIDSGATLSLGYSFNITGDTSIICQKQICFGNECLLSWDILVMDTDFHDILDNTGQVINAPKSIDIGNHVWIGCRSTILKGANISSGSIIAANSIISKKIHEKNCIIGGHGKGCKVIKENIEWHI